MTKIVVITHEKLKEEMYFAEMLFGKKEMPAFEGELLAVNPTKEEFATFNSNFADYVEHEDAPDIIEGAVYFDAGADRAFLVDLEHIEIRE